MAIAFLLLGRIVSSRAMGQLQASIPVAAGSASDSIPILRYRVRIIHPDIFRTATSSRSTRLDHLLQTKAMGPTSGETLQTPAARIAPSTRFSKHRNLTLGKFTGLVGLAEHPNFKDRFLKNVVKVRLRMVSQAMGARRDIYEVLIHLRAQKRLKKCPLLLPLILHPKKIYPECQSNWGIHPYRPTPRQVSLGTSGRAGSREGFRGVKEPAGRGLPRGNLCIFHHLRQD